MTSNGKRRWYDRCIVAFSGQIDAGRKRCSVNVAPENGTFRKSPDVQRESAKRYARDIQRSVTPSQPPAKALGLTVPQPARRLSAPGRVT